MGHWMLRGSPQIETVKLVWSLKAGQRGTLISY